MGIASVGRAGGEAYGYLTGARPETSRYFREEPHGPDQPSQVSVGGLLREATPRLSRVGLLLNLNDPEGARRYMEVSAADAKRLGITVRPIEVASASDFERAFSVIAEHQLHGVVSSQDGLFYAEMARMARLALARKLPLIGFAKEMAVVGGLMSYGRGRAGRARDPEAFAVRLPVFRS